MWKNLRGLAFCITQTKHEGNSFEFNSFRENVWQIVLENAGIFATGGQTPPGVYIILFLS